MAARMRFPRPNRQLCITEEKMSWKSFLIWCKDDSSPYTRSVLCSAFFSSEVKFAQWPFHEVSQNRIPELFSSFNLLLLAAFPPSLLAPSLSHSLFQPLTSRVFPWEAQLHSDDRRLLLHVSFLLRGQDDDRRRGRERTRRRPGEKKLVCKREEKSNRGAGGGFLPSPPLQLSFRLGRLVCGVHWQYA